MKAYHSGLPNRVSNRIIAAAVVILTGVLLLAFGYFSGDDTVIRLGLIVTVAGVALEVVFTIIGEEKLLKDKHTQHKTRV